MHVKEFGGLVEDLDGLPRSIGSDDSVLDCLGLEGSHVFMLVMKPTDTDSLFLHMDNVSAVPLRESALSRGLSGEAGGEVESSGGGPRKALSGGLADLGDVVLVKLDEAAHECQVHLAFRSSRVSALQLRTLLDEDLLDCVDKFQDAARAATTFAELEQARLWFFSTVSAAVGIRVDDLNRRLDKYRSEVRAVDDALVDVRLERDAARHVLDRTMRHLWDAVPDQSEPSAVEEVRDVFMRARMPMPEWVPGVPAASAGAGPDTESVPAVDDTIVAQVPAVELASIADEPAPAAAKVSVRATNRRAAGGRAKKG